MEEKTQKSLKRRQELKEGGISTNRVKVKKA